LEYIIINCTGSPTKNIRFDFASAWKNKKKKSFKREERSHCISKQVLLFLSLERKPSSIKETYMYGLFGSIVKDSHPFKIKSSFHLFVKIFHRLLQFSAAIEIIRKTDKISIFTLELELIGLFSVRN